jgi:hypothetical protein
MPSPSSSPAVVELRCYTRHPGRRDELIELFEREFIKPQERAGVQLHGLFRDPSRPDRFIWLRGFRDMASRKRALETFYGGPVWRAHHDAANATMIDSDNVLLLRFAPPQAHLDVRELLLPLYCATYSFATDRERDAFMRCFMTESAPRVERAGGTILAAFVNESSPNTFPALPVRGDSAFVLLVDGISRARLAEHVERPSELFELVPTTRSRMQARFTGKAGDFDFLAGSWNVRHRKLRVRLSGSTLWDEFSGTSLGRTLLNGLVSVDEMDFPATRSKGCSVRHLDLTTRRWSIYWLNSQTGSLFPPVHGGFNGDRGEFYGDDVEAGTPVLARYLWSQRFSATPRWEQAFSTDGGATWETNWTMDFSRDKGQ